jgi:hypothetical protein
MTDAKTEDIRLCRLLAQSRDQRLKHNVNRGCSAFR